jgi:hypothetical protein
MANLMLPEIRPFFLSFQSLLQHKIPAMELRQAGEEALWEYACLEATEDNRIPMGALVRLGSICLRYYRLMLRAGIEADEAIASISEACEGLEERMLAAAEHPRCSLAAYFAGKNAPELGAASFCRRCPKRAIGCPDLERLLILATASRRPAPRFIGKARIAAPARSPAAGALSPG